MIWIAGLAICAVVLIVCGLRSLYPPQRELDEIEGVLKILAAQALLKLEDVAPRTVSEKRSANYRLN